MNEKQKELKECKYCKSLIAADAKICPVCKKKQTSNTKYFILGILIAIMIISIGGLIFTDRIAVPESTEKVVIDDPPIEEEIPPVQNTPDISQDNLSVGQSADLDGMEITVNNLYEWNASGSFYEEDLPSGYTYLLINMTIKNNSDSDRTVFDLMNTGYVDGQMVDEEFIGDHQFSGDKLIPGTYTTGDIAFIVPDNWNTFQLRIEDWQSDSTAIYNLNRSNLSAYPYTDNHHAEHDY